VRFLGSFPRERILDVLPGYTGLIFSSLAFENAPLVCPEALASGVPILARAGSSAADSVRKYGTGAVYHTADELPRALRNARAVFPGLREHCRRIYADQYTAQSWNAAMTAVYERAVNGHEVLTP
jgi:glycosyltransferase involved in cell wall biosynthesis